MERRFQSILVEPPTKSETIDIIFGLRDRYEAHHKVRITDEAIGLAVELSDRYITSRFLPDKAIDVVDEAGARVRLKTMTHPPDLKEMEDEIAKLSKEKEEAVAGQDFEQAAYIRDKAEKLRKKCKEAVDEWKNSSEEIDGIVDEDVIAETVSSITGIPLTRLEKGEAERLLKMEEEMHRTVVSQDDAIVAIAKSVRRSRSGLKNPRRPMGCFLFLGPTGVGKTHLAKQLAKFMFGNEDALIQMDMSEYMEKFNASRLVGAPPGYVGYEEGGQLTEKVRRRPYSVVLLDEVEKAHSDIFNMLLQIMEEGRLTDSFGRNIDFRNVVIIMTSNIGANVIKNKSSLGFRVSSPDADHDKMTEQLQGEVEKFFRPEFLNRLDDVIIFKALTKENMKEILDIELMGIIERLHGKGISFELSQEARDLVIEKGTNLEFGARPLRRAIENLIEDPLSEQILKNAFDGKNHVVVKVENDKIVFEPKVVETSVEDKPEVSLNSN